MAGTEMTTDARRGIFDPEHRAFRETAAAFFAREVAPVYDRWGRDGILPRELFAKAGEQGLLAMSIPEEHGGAGVEDFRFSAVVIEEAERAAAGPVGLSLSLVSDICLPYLLECGTGEQAERWLPGVARGELILAIAMTEPGIGSDLASMQTHAARDADEYVLNGAKTFISNGINADLVIVAAKTDPAKRHDGISLLVVERGTDGFDRGRNLEKVGMHAQDTAELFFSDVRVPRRNLLGEEGRGFRYLVRNLAQERLSIALAAQAAAEIAVERTLAYALERKAFGRPVGTFQNSRFALAEMRTEAEVSRAFIDRCLLDHVEGRLTPERAAMAKWWSTELQGRVLDRCVQLHGGYGYMTEYPVARAWADARITRIYGGTTEIMKEIIGRSMGLK
jgi:alkylation response protein AidB-like acyl-CoA dehydrogenase